MFNLRYHITSLAAIFLALGVGILIGITLVDDRSLVEEQKYLIDGLENNFQFLREQNTLARREAENYKHQLAFWQEFSEQIFSYAIRDRLDGKRMVLVRTGSLAIPDNLLHNLELSGAGILGCIEINSFLQGERELLVDATAVAGQPAFNWNGLVQQIEEKIWDLVKISAAEDISRRTDIAVIIVGGATNQDEFLVDKLDLPLMELLAQKGVSVVGVAAREKEHSYLPYYQQGADIIIDHIESLPGQVALIWALNGSPGYYGLGPKAEGLLPRLP